MTTSGKPLAGSVALITRGARGIGLGIPKRLSADGAKIALVDLRDDVLADAAQEFDGPVVTRAADRTVERGSDGPVLISSTVARLRPFATVLGSYPVPGSAAREKLAIAVSLL